MSSGQQWLQSGDLFVKCRKAAVSSGQRATSGAIAQTPKINSLFFVSRKHVTRKLVKRAKDLQLFLSPISGALNLLTFHTHTRAPIKPIS